MSKLDKGENKRGPKSKKSAKKNVETFKEIPSKEDCSSLRATRSKKKKRKFSELYDDEDETYKPKHRKEKLLMEPQLEEESGLKEVDDEELHENVETAPHEESVDWPQSDFTELVQRISNALPEKDNLAFNTRVEKLNWDEIAFNNYSGDDCKKTWLFIQKRIRRFRLLGELLHDAKEWISKPWTSFYKGQKTNRHPDMPKKPLSVYMIFYIKKKDKIFKDNPGIELTEASKQIAQLYKAISPAKREKYTQMAAAEKKNYEEKLKEFYRLHPEIPRVVEKSGNRRVAVEPGPKKPKTPFGLYYEDQLKKMDSNSKIAIHIFKEQCKEQWKNMSDKKKVIWINWALEKEVEYCDELKHYLIENPDFTPGPLKPLLTKEEKLLKERVAGKPAKPPNSAYSLFSSKMLQGEEIKKIDSKDRMRAVALQWKNSSEEERDLYKERANHLMEQYKLNFASYLESLPEDKRQEELQNNQPKRKTKSSNENAKLSKKKKEEVPSAPVVPPQLPPSPSPPPPTPSPVLPPSPPPKPQPSKIQVFEGEPTQPPVKGYDLFCREFRGNSAERGWKKLSNSEKEKFETRVQKLKAKYIKEYKRFLESLSKEQLRAFSKVKQERELLQLSKKKKREESSSSSGDSSSSDDSEADSENEYSEYE